MRACLLALLLVPVVAGAQEIATPFTRDLDRLEEITERAANRLNEIALAARRGDRAGIRRYLGESVTYRTPLWGKEKAPVRVAREFLRSEHAIRAATVRRARAAFAAALIESLLVHKSVEDFRLDVIGGEIHGAVYAARVKCTLVGRDKTDRRVWMRGMASARLAPGKDGLVLTALLVEEMETLRATRDWFTEVAEGAGLAVEDPPVLEHPTLGLAAYGAAAADVDNDGLLDLFSTGDRGNTLYRNRGDGRFDAIDVPTSHKATGPLFLDYDNDGDADLFLSANGPQMLLENRFVPDGKVAFVDVSKKTGVNRTTIGFSAAAGDLNGDGIPDIYVTAYGNFGPALPDRWDDARNGLENLLFLSTRGGTYREWAKQLGVAGTDWSYAVQMVDVDGDGRLDLYVANDFGSGNRLYINRLNMRRAKFVDAARGLGVQDRGYGMGVCFGDFNNDGILDLHVTKMSSGAGNRILDRFEGDAVPDRPLLRALASGNVLFRGDGKGRFTDVSAELGPFRAGWAWGGGFVDIDNDGWEDLHTPNGHLSGTSMEDT